MDINFEYYKIFYYVAKYGNITRAAAALGSNQPNVTRTIKLLEAQLSCRLFIREARGVSLTEEGQRLFSHVEIAYNHLLNAQREICPWESEGVGTVEIGATETALHLFLLDAMADFREKYPRIRVKIHNHSNLEIIKYLTRGQLDFAVITTPFDVDRPFHLEKLITFQEILVGGPHYAHLGEEKTDLNTLKQFPWIGLGRGTGTYEFYKKFFASQGTDIEYDMEVATSDLMIPLIRHNLGIGFVPESLAGPFLDQKQLVALDFGRAVPPRAIEIISDRGRGKNRAADIFFQYLEHR